MINWSQESILVTGGTGSFGKKFVETMLRDYRPHRLVVFSRDELKQHEMRTSGFDRSQPAIFHRRRARCGSLEARVLRDHGGGARGGAQAGAGLRVQPVRSDPDQHHGRPQRD